MRPIYEAFDLHGSVIEIVVARSSYAWLSAVRTTLLADDVYLRIAHYGTAGRGWAASPPYSQYSQSRRVTFPMKSMYAHKRQ